MALTQKQRWIVWGALLVVSAIAAGQIAGDGEDTDLVEVARPARTTATRAIVPREEAAEASNDIQLDKLRRRAGRQNVRDVFTSQSWYVPPPPPKAAAEPAPTAPPLAFIYLGKMVEEGKLTVFLGKQDRNYTVREGDVIDNTYRVSAIKGSLMELTYIPLDIKQTMQIGEQN